MLKLIKSDMYKTMRRLYMKLYFAACVVIFAALPFLIKLFLSRDMEVNEVFTSYNNSFLSVYFCTIIIVDLIFSDEYKYGTMKNILSFGYSRPQIFLSKLLSSVLLGSAMFLILMGLLILCTVAAFPLADQAVTVDAISAFLLRCASFAPICLAGLALANTMAFLIKSNMMFAFGFLGITIIPSLILMALQNLHPVFGWMTEHSLMLRLYQFNERGVVIDTGFCLLYGILYSFIYVIFGLMLFRRMEIK